MRAKVKRKPDRNALYERIGRRYVPVGVRGIGWEECPNGEYLVRVDECCRRLFRLPDARLRFALAERELARLADAVAQAVVASYARPGFRCSAAEVGELAAEAVREFLNGEEVRGDGTRSSGEDTQKGGER